MGAAPRGLCRYCGRAVVWVVTEAGARMPIDPMPTRAGNIVPITRHQGTRARVLTTEAQLDPAYADQQRYMPHAATCPKMPGQRRSHERSSSNEDGAS